jgi:fatty acid synthase subunit alpha
MIHFGGIKGQAIQQCYMVMTYDTMDKDGHVKNLLFFADIDVGCPKYTFSHPGGLLFATQFAQIALVVTEKAACVSNLNLKALFRRIAHSLDGCFLL